MDGSPHDAVAEWKLRLAPWLQGLREAKLYAKIPTLPTADELRSLQLTFFSPDPYMKPHAWTLLPEAMELMELLARVDQYAAWILLFESVVQPAVAAQRASVLMGGSSADAVLPRFCISMNEICFEPIDLKNLRDLASKWAGEHTAGYDAAKSLLLQRWSEIHGGETLSRERLGRVKLSMRLLLEPVEGIDDEIERILVELLQLVRLFKNAALVQREEVEEEKEGELSDITTDGQPDQGLTYSEGGEEGSCRDDTASPLELDSIEMFLGNGVIVTPRMLTLLLELHESGVKIPTLAVSDLEYDTHNPDDVVDFLHNFFEAREDLNTEFSRDEDEDTLTGVKLLDFSPITVDDPAVEAIALAIAHSRSLKTVKARPTRAERPDAKRAVFWAWIAYALFSLQTTHNIFHVSLDVYDLDMMCLPAVRKVLCSNDPVTAVFQSGMVSPETPQPPSHVCDDMEAASAPTVAVILNSEARLTCGHRNAAISINQRTIESVPDCGYRVVRDNHHEDYVEVIVPHSGVCWVPRNMVIGKCSIPPRASHPIRHLELQYVGKDSLTATIELVKLIGRPIQRVTISESNGRIGDQLFYALFEHCPDLERIDLECAEFESWQWLWSQPPERFKLEALSASTIGMKHRASWLRLFEKLSDPTTPASQSLRRLHLNLYRGVAPRSWPNLQEKILGHAVAMLSKNRRLQQLECLQCAPVAFDTHNAPLLAHNGEPVFVEEAPLAAASTLAFLSVVTRNSTSTASKKAKLPECPSSAQYRLSSEAIRSILAFAAQSKLRVSRIYRESGFTAERIVLD